MFDLGSLIDSGTREVGGSVMMSQDPLVKQKVAALFSWMREGWWVHRGCSYRVKSCVHNSSNWVFVHRIWFYELDQRSASS